MAIDLGNAFSYLDVDLPQGGINAVQLPVEKPFMPGYNEEMNIDDSGKIRFADYLKEFGDTAQGGLTKITNQGMSLFDDSRRSNLIRAGLGSVLFGFNPLTALLGAFIGQKSPGIYSALKGKNINPLEFVQEQRSKREAEKAAEVARIARKNLAESMGSDSGPGEGAGTFGASVNEATGARGSGTGFSDYS